jgi:hypothetical protein
MGITLRQRLTLRILEAVFRPLERFIPTHDSWSPPRTLAGRDLLRLRLEQLEALRKR